MQLQVQAFDNGSPPLINETIFRITVNRNLKTPQWNDTNYEVNISSTQAVDSVLLNLRAYDSDTTVNKMSVIYSRVYSNLLLL